MVLFKDTVGFKVISVGLLLGMVTYLNGMPMSHLSVSVEGDQVVIHYTGQFPSANSATLPLLNIHHLFESDTPWGNILERENISHQLSNRATASISHSDFSGHHHLQGFKLYCEGVNHIQFSQQQHTLFIGCLVSDNTLSLYRYCVDISWIDSVEIIGVNQLGVQLTRAGPLT
jgi:hypothetical protein